MVTSGNTTYAVEHEPNRIVIGERLRAELVRRVHELEHRADPSRTPRAFCLAGNTQGGVTAMNDREPVPAVVIGLVAAAISGGIVGALITAIITLMAMSRF
jgi:hypothetical protein